MESTIQPGFELSVVVLVYNKQDDIRFVLESMCHQKGVDMPWEVVVVDDGSTDDTKAQVAGFSGRLNLKVVGLSHTGNRGECRNQALSVASGRYLLFLDGDMMLSRDFIRRHLDNVRNGCISLGRRVRLVQFDRSAMSQETVAERFSLIEDLPGFEDERTSQLLYFEKAGKPHVLPWMQFYSHNFCMARATFERIEGFDDDFSKNWGLEDVELGYRLHMAGEKILYDTGIVSYHIPHPEDMERKILQLRLNLEVFYRKHPHPEIELYSIEHRLWPVKFFAVRTELERAHPHVRDATLGLLAESHEPVADRIVSDGFTEALRRRRKLGPSRKALILTVTDSQENCYNQNFFHNFAYGLISHGVIVELRHANDSMAERPVNGYFGGVAVEKAVALEASRSEYLGAIDDLVLNIHDSVFPWQVTRSIGKRYVWRDRQYHNDTHYHGLESRRTEGFFSRYPVANGGKWFPVGVDGRFFSGEIDHDVGIFLKNAWELPRFDEFLGVLRRFEKAGIRTQLHIGAVSPIAKSPFVNHAFHEYVARYHANMAAAQERALLMLRSEQFGNIKVFHGEFSEEVLAKAATGASCLLDWSYHRETSPWSVYALLAGRILVTPNPDLYAHYQGNVVETRAEIIPKRMEGVLRQVPGIGTESETCLGINKIDPEAAYRNVSDWIRRDPSRKPDFRKFEWSRISGSFIESFKDLL